eukprot:g28132.t1
MPNLNACVALASAIESFKAGIVKTFAVSLGRGKKVFFRCWPRIAFMGGKCPSRGVCKASKLRSQLLMAWLLRSRLHGLRKSKATPQEVLFIVSECQRRQLLKDPRDWVVAMSSLGHAMHLETAVAVHAFNATLSAVQRAQQWEAAVALFADIERYSLTPDTVTCNALLTACDKGGQWQSALSLLERIGPTYHLQPNVVSYSLDLSPESAIKTFFRKGGSISAGV